MRREKCSELSRHNPLPKPRQQGLGLCKGPPTRLDVLTRLLQDDHLRTRFFVTMVITHDQVDGDLPGGILRCRDGLELGVFEPKSWAAPESVCSLGQVLREGDGLVALAFGEKLLWRRHNRFSLSF